MILQSNVCAYEEAYQNKTLGESLHPGGLDLMKHAFAFCQLPAQSKILDIGCGSGVSVKYLQQEKFIPFGIDLSRSLLQTAQQEIPSSPFVFADANEIPLASNSFDCVLAECSLSLLYPTRSALKQFDQLLVENGLLVITDIYTRNPSEWEKLRALLPSSCLAHAFVKEEILDLLKQHHFQLLLWEDHTELLRNIIQPKSLKLIAGADDFGMDAMDLILHIARAKMSYFLCIAKKLS